MLNFNNPDPSNNPASIDFGTGRPQTSKYGTPMHNAAQVLNITAVANGNAAFHSTFAATLTNVSNTEIDVAKIYVRDVTGLANPSDPNAPTFPLANYTL